MILLFFLASWNMRVTRGFLLYCILCYHWPRGRKSPSDLPSPWLSISGLFLWRMRNSGYVRSERTNEKDWVLSHGGATVQLDEYRRELTVWTTVLITDNWQSARYRVHMAFRVHSILCFPSINNIPNLLEFPIIRLF